MRWRKIDWIANSEGIEISRVEMDEHQEWNSKNLTFLYAVEMQPHFNKLVVEMILKWFCNKQYHNYQFSFSIFGLSYKLFFFSDFQSNKF